MRKIYYLYLIIFSFFIRSGQSDNFNERNTAILGFRETNDKGIIENLEIDEASGLVASELHKDSLWVINDSNDLNRIFLIDQYGGGRSEFFLKGIKNRDWESLAYWKNSLGQTFIYVGDIGDNNGEHEIYSIHRFQEPCSNSTEFYTGIIKNVETIKFILPDGSRDMEAMFVDQLNGDIYLISKREDKKRLYRIPNDAFENFELAEADFIMKLNFSQPSSDLPILKKLYYITAADISRNNDEIIIRNYMDVFYWKKNKFESIRDALRRDPLIVPSAREAQGEAIAFSAKSDGYFSISEQMTAYNPVHVYFTGKKEKK
jgi:hypothetical protein